MGGGSVGSDPSAPEIGEAWMPGRLLAHGQALPVRLRGFVRPSTLWSYAQLLGGSVTRLALSLVYFLALTRSLSLADFGVFASAVAVGTVLARLAAFGYGANLLQVSATRPRLLPFYVGIYGLWMVASLPLCAAAAWIVFAVSFDAPGLFLPYLLVVTAEAVAWRMLDVISTVNSGLGRFGYAAATFNIGTAGRALAATAFLASGDRDLGHWTCLYLVANVAALVVVAVALMPRLRPRYRRGTVLLRWRNALALGGAGLASSAQLETDKLLVLTFGGATTAGLYAICIRVIDLTAMPVRAFNVLMIQRVLKEPGSLAGRRMRVQTEVAVALASTAAYAVLLFIVRLWPGAFGQEIGRASGIFGLLWAVPALRNLAEYQMEFLYAHGRMVATFKVSLLLMAVKTALMAAIFAWMGRDLAWVVPMNGVFLVAYAISAAMTYRAIATTRPAACRP